MGCSGGGFCGSGAIIFYESRHLVFFFSQRLQLSRGLLACACLAALAAGPPSLEKVATTRCDQTCACAAPHTADNFALRPSSSQVPVRIGFPKNQRSCMMRAAKCAFGLKATLASSRSVKKRSKASAICWRVAVASFRGADLVKSMYLDSASPAATRGAPRGREAA